MKAMARLFENTFGPSELPHIPETQPQARLRRKLWELPGGWHCPLVGSCITIAELRQLAKRAGLEELDKHDYALHSHVVEHCSERCSITELLQRHLDQRYAVSVQQFAKARGGDAVLALWRKALAEGNIAGSLWAAWTHPDIQEYEGAVIYGELHMLSHRLGAQEREEKKRLLALEQDNARLHEEIASLRLLLSARERHIVTLKTCLAENELQLTQLKQNESALAAAGRTETLNQTLRERNATLTQRLATLERRNASFMKHIAGLESEAARLRLATNQAGTAPEIAAALDTEPDENIALPPDRPGDARLAGRRVVCIGGRTRLIDRYRRLVEASGGRFFHHDGGQEDNEHRIDLLLSNADAVLCQVSHLSHPAYWRIKDTCKQRGLPCIFLKSSGITTFARNVEALAGEYQDASLSTLFGNSFNNEMRNSP